MSLESIFRSYTAFGQDNDSMPNDKFAKLARDKGLLDKKLTLTDVDLIFTKAIGGPKYRMMNYDMFQKALAMMGKTKYGAESDENTQRICDKILSGKEPSTSKGTNVDSVSRLTDTSKYTGSHKERFDESGKGKGLEGRKDMSNKTGYVGAYKGESTYDKTE